jgi:hypothetical protein
LIISCLDIEFPSMPHRTNQGIKAKKRGRLKMTDLSVNSEAYSVSSGSTDWSAIWAGLFTFVGIWSVFEILGLAIFPAINTGGKVGLGIWSVVLTAIAMLIAGRQTGASARLAGRDNGARHGMIMFGLSLTVAIVLMMTGSVLLADFPAVNTSARSSDLVSVFTSSDWVPFATLFFGWVGAIIGASSGGPSKKEERSNVTQMRPAA